MRPRDSVCVVVPARNEEQTIGEIIAAVRPYADHILVVDGRSKDKTAELARAAGAEVLIDNGRGKGAALRQAMSHVTQDIIVFIDADGSHDPRDIPRLVEPIMSGQADMVLGSRMRGGSDELHGSFTEMLRLWGSGVITLLINWRFGLQLTDYQNGFRAIRTKVAKELRLKENHTTIEQEMSMDALLRGYRVTEIPTHEYRRRFGTSNISLLKHGPRYPYQAIKKLYFSRRIKRTS